MRIGIDAMGGDHAPREIVRGVAGSLALLDATDEVVLFGPQERIEAECAEHELSDPRVKIHACSQVIEMHESPMEALRQKRDSTIARMAALAGKGELDAVISAGNTGAFAGACQLRIKTLPGVSRPGIAVTMPTFHGPVIVCDVGANLAPKPHHLYEYAHMASAYARMILGVESPRVGLASIGEEAGKGNALVKEATELLTKDGRLHFVGNVEGRDLFAGNCDVFVCDGFVGNVILKLTEGLAEGLFRTLAAEIEQEDPSLARQFEPIVERIWKRHDFAEYGGAPLLGVNSVVIICHGCSDHRAIRNAIRAAGQEIRSNLNGFIADQMNGVPKGVE